MPAPLVRGVLHEWLGVVSDAMSEARPRSVGTAHQAPRQSSPRQSAPWSSRRSSPWLPPVGLMAHLARSAALQARAHGHEPLTVWIGRRIWPTPHALVRARQSEPMTKRARQATIDLLRTGSAPLGADDATVLDRVMLIDAPDAAQRLWAVDLALRSPVVTMVVADGSGFDIAATRRLQLAAKSRGSARDGSAPLALLVRPARESAVPSVATTRWCVHATPTGGGRPCWRIDLLRCRGPSRALPGTTYGRASPVSGTCLTGGLGTGHPATSHAVSSRSELASSSALSVLASFYLEWDHALGPVPASPGVVDRPRSAPEPVAAGRSLGRIMGPVDERGDAERPGGARRVGRTA